MTADLSLQQLSLQLASQQRSCPDDALLFSDHPSPDLKAHLKGCPHCRERRKSPPANPSALRDAFAILAGTFSKPSPVEPAPGEIWKLRHRITGWGPGNRYFNPPLVLLLQQETTPGEYRVSQIYSDDLLMGADDIPLGEGLGFAQPWNIYAVHRRDLERRLAFVGNEIVDACSPHRLLQPRDIPSDPIVRYFREMEREVGEIMALRSSQRCAEDLLHAWLSDGRRLAASLADRVKGWLWPDTIEDAWGFLAAARPELLPLTAAEGDERHDITLLQIRTGAPPGIYRKSCIVSRWGVDADGLLVRGFLPEEAAYPCKFHARWVTSGAPVLCADEAEFDGESGAFKIRFHDLNDQITTLDPLQLALVTLA